jgi:hypothetical protein
VERRVGTEAHRRSDCSECRLTPGISPTHAGSARPARPPLVPRQLPVPVGVPHRQGRTA